jgi:hypothetical protein
MFRMYNFWNHHVYLDYDAYIFVDHTSPWNAIDSEVNELRYYKLAL